MPFWLIGAGFGLWGLTIALNERFGRASNYSTVDTASTIDGVAIPAGATILRDENGALQTVDLPEGATLAANGATWRGHLEFATPTQTPQGARGQIATGTLAAEAVIQGTPCQGGHTVDFLWDNALSACTLASDAALGATIGDASSGSRTQIFTCRAGAIVTLQPVPATELASCVLAKPAEIGSVACASDAELRLSNGALDTCTLAQASRFGPLDLPPRTAVTYYDAQPSSFILAADAGDVPAFGLAPPGGTEGSFCYKTDKIERFTVDVRRDTSRWPGSN